MPTDVVMPQMGESIFEGTITKWLKQPGDAVEQDEPLFEISTDKVDVEIPAPVAGVVAEILVSEGATVTVNTVVARIAAAGEAVSAATPKPPVAPETVLKPSSAAPAVTSKPAATAANEMAVVMPQMGESIFEGTITKWLKQPGDAVRQDEPLFEISTDKVDVEIPSPAAGVVKEIRVAQGATVGINSVVAVLGTAASPAPDSAQQSPVAAPENTLSPKAEVAPKPAAAEPSLPVERGAVRSSPLVRRIARERQVDLNLLSGTGAGGRINKQDILGYLAKLPEGASPRAESALPALAEERVPMSRMRAMIAERMIASRRTSAHAHTVFRIDMTRIVRLREREKAGFEQRHGVRLTYMPFVAAAAIAALRRYPILNASMDGDAIQFHGEVNLGIAVALDWGLIVPVIHGADRRSFVELARAIADLAERARTKKLKPEEVAGGTFTLTNSGIFGEEFGTPILNQPESGILAIGGLKKEPVVLTDADGSDTLAIRSMQHYCLGIDHRIIDGADAGRFMTEFKRRLEEWSLAIG